MIRKNRARNAGMPPCFMDISTGETLSPYIKAVPMKKDIDETTGNVNFSLTIDELKKFKLAACAAGALFVVSLLTAGYSFFTMTSLRQQNDLYASQMKMADEKLAELDEKTKTIEKLSEELQQVVEANNNGAGANITGGTGGGSTVPDKARDVSPSEHGNIEEVKEGTPAYLLKQMRKLDSRLDRQIKLLVILREKLEEETYAGAAPLLRTGSNMPDMWPIHGPISSWYGFRESPGGFGSTYHEGVDIAIDYGAPIEATANGIVTQAGWVGGYGYLVEIKHDGGLVTRYGHNSAILVSVGEAVEQGTIIALGGSTGNSTGPHCHYEVRINGDSVDPTYFLP